jgi:hypothetical protein
MAPESDRRERADKPPSGSVPKAEAEGWSVLKAEPEGRSVLG